MAKRKRPQFTTVHEAGHVVALAVLGLVPRSATIVRDGDTLGFVEHPNVIFGYEGSGRRERQSRARNGVVVCFAGSEPPSMCCVGSRSPLMRTTGGQRLRERVDRQ